MHHPLHPLPIAGVLLALALAGAAQADVLPGQGTWTSVLQPRDLNADGTPDAWYDSSRDLTWAADADPLGATDWATASAWITSLNLHGVTGWRTPTMTAAAGGFPICDNGYSFDGSGDCGYNVDPGRSELAHMYQVVLGNKPYYDTTGAGPQPGWGLTNTGPFVNLSTGDYPTSLTSFSQVYVGEEFVWLFQAYWGYQDQGAVLDTNYHAWAVRDGDVTAVPEPSAWALMLAGGAVVGRLTRRRLA